MLTIKGLYSISTDILRPILKFVAVNLPLNEEISIEEEEDGLLTINDSESYLIITECEELDLMHDEEEYLFKEWTGDTHENVKKYIDKDAWLDDNGFRNFEEYWSKVHKDSLTYIDTIDNYNFYKVGE